MLHKNDEFEEQEKSSVKPNMLKTIISPVRRTKEEQLLNKYGGRSILDNKTKVTETNKHKLNLNKPTTIMGKDGTSQSRSNSRSVSATKSRPIYQKIFNDNKNYGYLRDSRNNKNFQSNRQSSYRQNKPVSKVIIDILNSNFYLGEYKY